MFVFMFPPSFACVYAWVASACSRSFPGNIPYRLHAFDAAIVAGHEEFSRNRAISRYSSTTWFPKNTTLPLNLRSGFPSFNSEPFSTQISASLPKCTFVFDLIASHRTFRYSLTVFSSQHSMDRNRFHSFISASCAFGVSFISCRPTGLATRAL